MADEINFDLRKKSQEVDFVLTKKGITKAPIMRVVAGLDISGSMSSEIRNGSLQTAVDQLGGVAITFDDNGEIDMFQFDDQVDYLGVWTPKDYKTYVRRHIPDARGGTRYSQLIHAIIDRMFVGKVTRVARKITEMSKGFLGFGKKPVEKTVYDTVPDADGRQPVLALIITDGEPEGETYNVIDRALIEAAKYAAFFVFVGVSNRNLQFNTLQLMEREHENVSFVRLSGFNLSDKELYDKLITDKLVGFLKKF